MASSSEFDSEGERQPLIDETPMATVCHRDSVFSFVLFMPPLTRRTHGHYCTVPVILALALFVITVTCQLSLTLIAGRYIQGQSIAFKVSLVRHQDWQATAITPIDYVRESAETGWQQIRSGWSEPKVDQCCDSAECVELYPCCGAAERPKRQHRELGRDTSSFLHRREFNASRFKNLVGSFIFGSSGDVALCRKGRSGLLDCSPPSYAYLDAWAELDDNGDGLWTLEEAEADRTNLGCRLGLSAKDFFNSAVRGTIKDARDTADHSYAIPLVPEIIENRKAIPKEYFEHFKGLVILCTAHDMGRCGQLISGGTFDGLMGLKSEAARGGVHDLDSALDFCQRLLRSNGVCEQSLPHTYQLYRSRVDNKCGSPSFEVGAKYTNPHNPRDAMSVVQVSYSENSQFATAHLQQFQIFLACILLIWYVTLVVELSRIVELTDLLLNIKLAHKSSYAFFTPSLRDGIRSLSLSANAARLRESLKAPSIPIGDPRLTLSTMHLTQVTDGTDHLVIEDLSVVHQYVCAMMLLIRFFLWIYMGNVGTTFLLSSFAYDDLLFDAVTLAFIFELPEFLYAFLISDEIKEQLIGAKTAPFPTMLPTSGWKKLLISRAVWGLVIIPASVLVVLRYNYDFNISSSLEALNCACFQSGPNCVASHRFATAWWNKYWQDTYPLAKLRSSYLS